MAQLIHNEVLRVDAIDLNGLYRVIAHSPDGDVCRLAYLGVLEKSAVEQVAASSAGSLVTVARATLSEWVAQGVVRAVDIRPAPWMLTVADGLPEKARLLWETRARWASPMLTIDTLERTVGATGSLGQLVRLVLENDGCSRPQAYNLWRLLVKFGFGVASLLPRFDQCGAPGVSRPVTEQRKKAGRRKTGYVDPKDVPNPQRGITEADRIAVLYHYRRLQRPGLSGLKLYDSIVQAAFVTEYVQQGDSRLPVLPPQGTFPNKRQVRHIIESGIDELERLLRKTTRGHFDRSLRGMRGRAYDGVPGPGHTFAIDSTVGDVHLRSAVNPAWIIGRPIVYVIVDVYSTAVVGFYVCLEGPAWRDAKLAIFSALCERSLANDLYGFEWIETLWPRPTLPHRLRCDRGEYLSAEAKKTAAALSFDMEFAPSRRPDWKGSVEVLHRISKDAQYAFVPGAFDARRKELELRSSRPKESALNLREYVQTLHGYFSHYNLHANRADRMTAEMIASGIDATPAGIWRFGHESGYGNLRSTPHDLLAANLLPRGTAVIRRNGVFFDSLEYASAPETMQVWTGRARNAGVIDLPVYYYPSSTSRIWWADPEAGLSALQLRGNARAPTDVSFYDWRDALVADLKRRDDQAYRRLQASVELLVKQRAIAQKALQRTRDAEAETPAEAVPKIREARALERTTVGANSPAIIDADVAVAEADVSAMDAYAEAMNSVFSEINAHGRD